MVRCTIVRLGKVINTGAAHVVVRRSQSTRVLSSGTLRDGIVEDRYFGMR